MMQTDAEKRDGAFRLSTVVGLPVSKMAWNVRRLMFDKA
jgi:hypothetical protein